MSEIKTIMPTEELYAELEERGFKVKHLSKEQSKRNEKYTQKKFAQSNTVLGSGPFNPEFQP